MPCFQDDCYCSAFSTGTDGFLIKNTQVNLCLQASTTDENLLLEDCNSTSKSQHWFWQDNALVNRGTRKCLSVAEVNRVQTSLCDSAALVNWDCFNFWLQPMGIQKYLAVKKKKAVLTDTQSPNSQWRARRERSVCDERPGKHRAPKKASHLLCLCNMNANTP